MRRTSRLSSVAAALALVVGLAGCGDDDDAATGGTATTDSAPPETAAVSDADQEAGEEPVAGCQRLDERPDGVYRAGDGGEVELQVDGDQVTVGQVLPSEGWTLDEQDVDEASGDDDGEVEITFTQDERSIDLEAVVADGELVIEVCES